MNRSMLLQIQAFTATKNAQGLTFRTFYNLKMLPCLAIPKTLTETEMLAWGVDQHKSNALILFYDPDFTIKVLYRVIDNDGLIYDLRAVHHYQHHHDALCIPADAI